MNGYIYQQSNMMCPPPDKDEKKQLRRYYFRIAWIVVTLIFVFSILNTLILQLCAAMLGGGYSKEQIDAGKEIIRSTPLMKAIYSYGFPFIADIAAFGVGLLVTKTDIRKKFTVKGITSGSFLKFTALSFGVVTVGSVINVIISAIAAALSGKLSDFSVNNTSALNIAPQNNPLWLEILIYLYICLLGPIMEELIFRGVLLDGLRKYGNTFGIIMSAVLFGLMHQNFSQCLPAVCMGLVWAYIAVKYNSLVPSMILHIINNSMSAVLMVLIQNSSIDISNLQATIMGYMPLVIASLLNVALRLACIIASIVIIIRFYSSGGKLFRTSLYSKQRTWKYFFTSVPWLVVIAYMLYGTVTTISI